MRRDGVGLVLAVLVCVGGLICPGSAAAAAAPGIAYYKSTPPPEGDPSWWDYAELGVADSSGADQRPLLPSWPPLADGGSMALSPDGQMVAHGTGPLQIVNTANGANRTVRADAGYDPAFAPDGRTILLSSWKEDSDLVTTDVYGREPTTIVDWPLRQLEGDYSAAGDRISFLSESTPDGTPLDTLGLYIANADGTGAQRVPITASEITDVLAPALSASGTRIAFSAWINGPNDLWVVNVDGSGLEQITETSEISETFADWSADDSKIMYRAVTPANGYGPSSVQSILPTGTGVTTLISSGTIGNVSYRQPSTVIGKDDVAAHQFRPVVRFDSSEPWRPLEVERFLEEDFSDGQPGEHHEICSSVSDTASCETIDESDAPGSPDAWTKLRDYRAGAYAPEDSGSWPVISIHGTGNEIDNFESPRLAEPGCVHPGDMRDCDTGQNTAMYYRASGPFLGADYKFLDYWMFFRYNKFGGGFDHEADWEHITVARAAQGNPTTFAWVGMSGHHDNTFRYLRDVLRCDDNLSQGSCGTESDPTGERPVAFVANGSHAIYPESCQAVGGAATCDQSTASGQTPAGEKGYDGVSKWGADSDPAALRAWPDEPTTWSASNPAPYWVNWPGKWGLMEGDSSVESPASPTRNVFYEPWTWECSERGTPGETTDCPDGGSARAASTAASDDAVAQAQTAGQCQEWAGPGLVLAACDPDQLASSLRDGSLGVETDSFAAAVNGNSRRGTRSRGVVQVAGDPLKPGQTLTLDRPLPAGASLRVNVIDRRVAKTAYFEPEARRLDALTVRFPATARVSELVLGRGARAREPSKVLPGLR